jgi:hypothetical protein
MRRDDRELSPVPPKFALHLSLHGARGCDRVFVVVSIQLLFAPDSTMVIEPIEMVACHWCGPDSVRG